MEKPKGNENEETEKLASELYLKIKGLSLPIEKISQSKDDNGILLVYDLAIEQTQGNETLIELEITEKSLAGTLIDKPSDDLCAGIRIIYRSGVFKDVMVSMPRPLGSEHKYKSVRENPYLSQHVIEKVLKFL